MAEFTNPSQGGGGTQDNKSLLLMMIVMFGVIFGLQFWRAKHNPQTASPAAPVAQQTQQSTSQPSSPQQAQAAMAGAATASSVPSVPSVQAAAETTTVVENDLYRITFSNRGAQAISWVLKKYRDNDGKPLDLVHDGAAKQFGYPLSLYTYDAALTNGLANVLYVPSASGSLAAPATLSYSYSFGNVAVKKTFTFENGGYAIHADTLVLQNGAPVRALLSWPAAFGDAENALAYAGEQIDTSSGGKEDHESFKKISTGNTLYGPFDWAGVSDQYFAAIFLPDAPASASLATFHHDIDVNKVKRSSGLGQGVPSTSSKPVMVPVLGTAMGDTSGHTMTRLFVGPKAVDVLGNVQSTTGQTLKPLLDFGFFGPIGKYLFLALRGIHSFIAPDPNSAIALTPRNRSWGWAIILLTIAINLVLLPLRIQGMRSMLKMQRIQPGIDAIKAKWKNPKPTDPKAAQMNAEVMAYQKEQGVNMFGGCIPMLIQLPLLFAFFSMLPKVVELRQAHFFWLPDLSSYDPHYILPVLMVITSFVVQRYTPSPGVDPQQQRMMAYMMPLFSGFMTYRYASGLAIYWVTGNLIMMAQQAIMNQTPLGREIKEIAAKRALAKGSSNPFAKTIQARR